MDEDAMPIVMVRSSAAAYERLRLLAVELDGELLAVRQLLAADPTKVRLRRELFTVLGRSDYWYEMWRQARGEFDAPEWRGPTGKDGIWTARS